MSAAAYEHPAALALAERHRVRTWEALPWLLALAFYFAFPNHLGFGTDVLITILFAISLDLALGYAGIVTLGHAAFFGTGAYTVGMLAHHGIWAEPISGLIIAAAVAGGIGLISGLILLRTTGLTLLMLTLCTMALLEESANMAERWTHGFDGLPNLPILPVFGIFEFNQLYPNTQFLYVLSVLFVCFAFVRTLVYSPYGQSLTGIRENILRMHAVGAPVNWRLVTCYSISAAIAGIAGALWAQSNTYVNLSTLGLERSATVLIILVLGGYGRLYGAFVGAIAYMAISHFLAKAYPTAWQLGLGLLLVLIALFARNGILGLWDIFLKAARQNGVARPPRVSDLGKHWRGDFTLGWSVWINGVALGLAAFTLSHALISRLAPVLPDIALKTVGLALTAMLIALVVWQIAGIWRSARAHVGRGGQRGWTIAAQVACMVSVLAALAAAGRAVIGP